MDAAPQKFAAGVFLYNPATTSVLLHQRDDKTPNNPNQWAFFGGLNEEGETPIDCARRELKEETGIEPPMEDFILLHHNLGRLTGIDRFIFSVEKDVDPKTVTLTEGKGIDWLPLARLDDYDIAQQSRTDLDEFIKMKHIAI